MTQQCTHLDQITITQTDTHVCEDCIKLGDHWVHLRMCLICGHVGCCDSSKNKHATKHFQSVGHPLIRSLEPGETWVWCFVLLLVVALVLVPILPLDSWSRWVQGLAAAVPATLFLGEYAYRHHRLRAHRHASLPTLILNIIAVIKEAAIQPACSP